MVFAIFLRNSLKRDIITFTVNLSSVLNTKTITKACMLLNKYFYFYSQQITHCVKLILNLFRSCTAILNSLKLQLGSIKLCENISILTSPFFWNTEIYLLIKTTRGMKMVYTAKPQIAGTPKVLKRNRKVGKTYNWQKWHV